MMKKATNEQIMELLNTINDNLTNIEKRVSKLEEVKNEAPKSTPKARKSTKSTATKTTTTKTSKAKSAPKDEEPKKKLTLKDFEPKRYEDGYYRWGMKTDGFNQKSYMGMRKAYCVYKATNGEYMDSKKAYAEGIRIDYSEGGAYAKAKAEFEKKYKYVKKEDRQTVAYPL